MAELSIKDKLDSIRDKISIHSKLWENVLINFTEGYAIAVKEHSESLPTKMVDPAIGVIFSMISASSTAWLAGKWVVAMTSIASAITSLGEKIATPPDSAIIQNPGYSSSSASYFNMLKSTLNTFEANALTYIRKCRYQLDKNGDVKISSADIANIDVVLELSPYWFPPKELIYANEPLQKEFAIEFEIGFWAEWGKQLKKSKR